MHSAINNIAALYQETVKTGINTQIAAMFLADQSDEIQGTSTSSLGTGIHQQNQLWEYAPILGLFSDDAPVMLSEFSDMCGFGSAGLSPNCMDVWPFDFVMPSGRDTPMPADPTGASGQKPCGEGSSPYNGTNVKCAVGGSYDSNILCNGITGLYCFEFEHLWVFDVTGSGSCTAFDRRQWFACAQDRGPLLVVINGSGASRVVSASNLSGWAPHTYSRLGHVLVPCTPLSTYWGSGSGAPIYAMPQSGSLGYGTAAVCNGSSGQDVPNGGTFDYSKSLSDITSNSQVLYDGQVLLVVH